MSQGAPVILPPEILQNAISDMASSSIGFGYSSNDGEPLMRRALAAEMGHVYGPDADINAEDIALTAGCNLAFTMVAMTLLDPGDEVILPSPWLVCLSW